ncbi:hypothetical protein D9Q98_001963 [Chlorella vulgaris]|uniref:Uncharacterized protein n=1 Tax=Chlorella vulgaris TaxID=3077 RepID=A0A9D4TVY3_CHLVU|nr:hypothetical protein D9Q98_001963 [Chlorella vulgaris]
MLVSLLLPLLTLLGSCPVEAAKKSKAGLWHSEYNKLTGRSSRNASPEFCVVVRTYWGHGRSGDGGLRRLLRSLQRQSVQSWEAVLLVLDSRPFEDLHHIVEEFQDDRIWVFAEWIDKQFTPKQGVEWAPGYHGTLYNLTDDAIQVCPPTTKWLVVTNGDNEYADTFMQLVRGVGPGADLVAVDFYSRFQRPTAPSCERFAAAPGLPACKRNRLRWCHTDLGANVIAYPRFVQENRRFGALADVSGGLGAEHFDGIMMQLLMASSWKVQHLHDTCPFNHAPSLQSCGWGGGVWDDRDIVSWATAGGRCISREEADRVLQEDEEAEEATVAASNDGTVTAYEGVKPEQMAVPCLRKKAYMSDGVLGVAVEWFNALCVDDVDLPAFREWQQLVDPAGAAAEAAALGGEGGDEAATAGTGELAARAAAIAAEAAARREAAGGEHEPEDFWALQAGFYQEEVPAGAAHQQQEQGDLAAAEQAAAQAVHQGQQLEQQQHQRHED